MRQINFYLSAAITLALLIALIETAIAEPLSAQAQRVQTTRGKG